MTTRIGFQGFAAGADVVLSSDGEVGTTEPGGWPVQAQAGTQQSARIVMRRSQLQVAPEGVNFEVVLDGFDTPGPASPGNPYDPQFHNIYYFWDFGDPGSVFTAPENVPDVHKNANRGYGPLASHTYQRPGSYNPTCLVIEPSSGKTALASLRDEQGNPVSITVGDPDMLFAGDRTIFVNPSLDSTRAPAGVQIVATALDAHNLQGTLQSANPSHYYRVMFDRNVQHLAHNTSGVIRPRSQYTNIYWCASPGSSTAEKIFCSTNSIGGFFEDETARSAPGKQTDVVFDGLNVDGYYDPTTGIQNGPNASIYNEGQAFYLGRDVGFATYSLFNNVTANGFNTFINIARLHQDGPDAVCMVVNNTSVDGWSNFAAFEVQQGISAYTGVRFRQNPEALSGGAKDGQGNNTHGPIRIELAGKCIMHSCHFFSRNGWTENLAPGVHIGQPCVRWNQIGDPRGKLNMQACALESSERVFSAGITASPSATVTINNILVDKCSMVSGVFAGDAITVQHSGFTMRNCIAVQGGNRTLRGTFIEVPLLRFDSRIPDLASVAFTDQEYVDAPFEVYSNTFMNLIADNEAKDGNAFVDLFRLTNTSGTDFTNVTLENNVYHQPNLTIPDEPHAPLGASALWSSEYDGVRDLGILSDEITLTGDVVDSATVFVPYTAFPGNRSQSDFDINPPVNAAHQTLISNVFRNAAYAFDTSGITVTNNSGTTWASGDSVSLNLGKTGAPDFRPEYATNVDLPVAAPLTGSSAIGAALSGLTALDDFFGFARPQYPSVGAFEAFSMGRDF